MADKKSIYEKALLDIKVIQEALNANTKEILRSVGKEEIDGLVQESLQEGDYEEEDVDTADDDTETADTEAPESDDSTADDTEGGEDSGEEISVDSDETDVQVPDEVGGDDQDSSMDADALGGDELDMTAASDDDVIAIYKKLSGDDEIEIVGDEIHMNISEPGEYIITKGGLGGGSDSAIEEPIGPEIGGDAIGGDELGGDAIGGDEFGADAVGADAVGGDEFGAEDDTDEFEEGLTYEIAMDDEATINETKDIESISAPTVTEEEDEDENLEETEEEEDTIEEKASIGTGMSVGTHRGNGPKSIGATENPKSKNESVTSKKVVSEAEVKYKKLLGEAAKLKTENDEFREALKKFRSMLIETVVFNSNLSYVTKLFMEHSTTKDEKKKIIQRFDEEVSDLPQSKRLYKTIVNELASRKPMNEAIENKITKEVTSSSSKQLNEATAYVDPSTQRIRDLINRVENR